jgi:hypothetical protein
MSELYYELQYWNTDKEKWSLQAGNDKMEGILKEWERYTRHYPDVKYKLVLCIRQEIVLEETE